MTDEGGKADPLPQATLPLGTGSPLSNDTLSSSVPNFSSLLASPLVDSPLPKGFDKTTEAEHLRQLWLNCAALQNYEFCNFVHAGGSGMVFRVRSPETSVYQALKIARKHLCDPAKAKPNAPSSLSPVSQTELLALEKVTHPNVVRLFDALETERGIVAISTTYIDKPQPLDSYLRSTLAKDPDPHKKKGIHPFSPQRLDDACSFLVKRCQEIAAAIDHMHQLNIFHFDIKPANILIPGNGHSAILTDLGACVHSQDLKNKASIRVQFTWTYAHDELTSLVSDPGSISGGGLKATASVDPHAHLAKFDLFAFGRTIQEALAILEQEFGERCYAAYGFRFLHIISCLLLDARNAVPSVTEPVAQRHGKRFVSDAAMGYPVEIYKRHKITSAGELVERLSRFSRQYSWYAKLPELDAWQPEVVNTGAGDLAPFTRRVAQIFNHPCLRRLKNELQLGWVKEVYPGATHSRWSHSIGVFSTTVAYYNALLADPEVPTFRVLLNPEDVEHGLVAAMLHDVGQTAFAHDFEASCPELYKHEDTIERLLDEDEWGKPTLRETLERFWPRVDIGRVLKILQHDGSGPADGRVVDGVSSDIIDGPIDADKLDYLIRDSVNCGVPYGLGIDQRRLLQALSVDARSIGKTCRLAVAYRAKGAAAIESLLLARYQMYGAVYWHHSYRCIQAMFVQAFADTFGSLRAG